MDNLYLTEFWDFLTEFDKEARKAKRKDPKTDPSAWIRDPSRKK